MQHTLTLSDEELDEIDHVLEGEIRTTRVELRRTRNLDYRHQVRHHLDVMERVHERMHHAAVEGLGYASYE